MPDVRTKRTYVFDVNGLPVEAVYAQETIDTLFLPLLEQWTDMQKRKPDKRLVVFLAAPPAVGKSTLASFLAHLSETVEGLTPVQVLGLDGFHYPQAYLNDHVIERNGQTIPMAQVKGCADTFDAESFASIMSRIQEDGIRFPEYSRVLHDVIPDRIPVTGKIVLIEGNWLLRDEPRWAEARTWCDQSVFIRAKAGQLRERLIGRKIKGGLKKEEAEAFYEASDKANVTDVLDHSVSADVVLAMDEEDNYVRMKG